MYVLSYLRKFYLMCFKLTARENLVYTKSEYSSDLFKNNNKNKVDKVHFKSRKILTFLMDAQI